MCCQSKIELIVVGTKTVTAPAMSVIRPMTDSNGAPPYGITSEIDIAAKLQQQYSLNAPSLAAWQEVQTCCCAPAHHKVRHMK